MVRDYSRIEHIVASGRSGNVLGVRVAAITVYVDDSGSDPNAPIAVAACVLAPVSKWKRLEREWGKALLEFGADSLHTSECVARNKKSDFADWSDSKVEIALKRFRHLTKSCGTVAFGSAIRKKDFDAYVPDDLREIFGNNHFCWSVFHMLGILQTWRLENGITDEFEFVFDQTTDKDTKKRIDRVFDWPEYESFFMYHYGIRPGLYSFRFRKELKPLQAADLMAWTCYQRMHHAEGKLIKQIAKDSWNDFYKHKNKTFVHLGTPDVPHLEEWVKKTRESRLMRDQNDRTGKV